MENEDKEEKVSDNKENKENGIDDENKNNGVIGNCNIDTRYSE